MHIEMRSKEPNETGAPEAPPRGRPWRAALAAIPVIIAGLGLWPGTGKIDDRAPAASATSTAIAESDWGVKVLTIRRTAADHMLDFRFRILDADKAAPLLDPRNKPHLIHEKSGTRLHVPHTQIGSLRQTSRKVQANRNYFMLFDNPKIVRAGDAVTVVVGDFRVENLRVD